MSALEGRGPPYLTVLTDESSGDCSIVVPPGTDTLTAILNLIEEQTGERFERDNSFLVDESRKTKVEVWRSCTKAWRDAEGVENENYWAPDGDGRRWCHVVAFIRSPYVMAGMAEEAAGQASSGSESISG